MKLRTHLKTQKSEIDISYNDSLFFLGSCFGENISNILLKRKFNILTNPFGIAFNPISIFENLESVIKNRIYGSKDLVFNNEVYSCFDFHSDISSLNEDKLLENIQSKIVLANNFLQNTTVLFLTFGTAWIYEYETIENKIKIASNCHKFPSKKFRKRLLSSSEIAEKAKKTISLLKAFNKELKIVLTISPVRHLRDGFNENNLSKSTLHLAVNEILQNNANSYYFPAYEYVIDDLRDYRFYSKDLIHPNELAVEYVLDKFDDTFFNEDVKSQVAKIEIVNQALNHRVKYRETIAYEKFKISILKKINELENLGFDFSLEKSKLKS